MLGLVLLTPVLVHQLNAAPGRAIPPVTRAVITAPLSLATKIQLGAGLLAAKAHTPPEPAAGLRSALRPGRRRGRAG